MWLQRTSPTILRLGLQALFSCLACVSTITASPGERALSEYQKHDWQVEDGLPQGNVRTIAQSPDGKLLIGTGSGLVSFDGLRFVPVKVDAQDEYASEAVNALLYTRNGDLWIGTDDRGVIHRSGARSVNVSEEAGLTDERVRAIFEDSTGAIWVATQNGVERIVAAPSGDRVECLSSLGIVPGDVTEPFAADGNGGMLIVTAKGLFHWRDGSVQPLPVDGLGLGAPTAVYRDSHRGIWLGMERGVASLAPAGGSFRMKPQPDSHGPVSTLLGDREGNLWIGTRARGICRLSGQAMAHWTSVQGLADNTLRSMFEDSEGNLWFGMLSGGLSRWRQTAIVPYGQPEGMPEGLAAAVLAGRSGDLWLAAWGQGVLRLRQGQLTPVPLPGMPPRSQIRALAEDRDGGIWVGTWYDGIYHYDSKGPARYLTGLESYSNAVSALLVDRAGSLWVGTYRGMLQYSSGCPERGKEQVLLAGKLITAIREAPSGELLVGTSQGLYRIDRGFVTAITRKDGLSSDAVISISIDSAGAIWVGTKAGGLDRIVGDKAVRLPSPKIPSVPIFSVLDDGQGVLWMASTMGIMRVARDQLHALAEGRPAAIDLTVFGKGDGMRNSECVGIAQPPAARASDGSLWFATAKGFAHTNPSQIHVSLNPPRLRLTGVLLDHSVRPISRQIEIPAGTGEVQLSFEAVRLANPGQLRFRYKLENYDADWTETGSRQIVYKHLPAGSYRLLAGVRDHHGTWSDSASVIEVTQLPFVYQRWWFYALMTAAAAGVIAILFRRHVAVARNRMALIIEERNRIARDWHDTLMADFAAISWQLEATQNRLQAAPREAQSSLELARNMVKHCMAQARRIIWDLHDHDAPAGLLSEELSKAMATIGYKERLETDVCVEGSERPLPPVWVHHLVCIGQEALTNAWRHAGAHTVKIRLVYGESSVRMAVCDDGCGFVPAEPAHAAIGHFGLAVMHERARKLGGDLKILSSPGAGTEIVVNIPQPRRPL
jgi:signal transduction histidine kinase/ligand-binding sensor domain-containing protein